MAPRKIFVFFIFMLIAIQAKTSIIITENNSRYLIGDKLNRIVTDGEPSIEEVATIRQFTKEEQKVPNLGFAENSIWFSFTVTNKSSNGNLFLEIAYPILDEIELFKSVGNGKFSKQTLGEKTGFKDRKYKYPNYIFDINIPKDSTTQYFLRVKSDEQLILPIYVSSPQELWYNVNTESLINGIYFGIVLIMFFYNLFVFSSVKDNSYLYYVVYLIFVGFTQLSIQGYTYQYFWPNNPGFAALSSIIFASLSGIGAVLVTQSFLQTKQNTPKFHVFLNSQIVIFSIAFLLTVFNLKHTGFMVMQLGTTITTLSILVISCHLMLKKYAPATFFFFAWSVLVCGAVIFLLKDYGILPYNTLTSYSMQIASAIEMALLSFGLANRINILKKEKEASQAKALEIAKENELIIREQNIILEQKVDERTAELQEAYEELSVTLEDLKQTQTQLVSAEKMASLGQLTAGIAHEINNPINFVSSNVSPLHRDVDMLIETIEHFEALSLSNKPKEEIEREIEDYKEELDYDYLKIEISHLLKGIKEGAGRTAEIVKGLRIFSRIDEDDLKSANIAEGLDSTLVIMNSLIISGNITVEKNYESIPPVECYPGKLNQVFLNIISNAIHAINKRHENNGNGKLKVSVKGAKETVSITITDNGSGMNEATLNKIFDPFFTTKDVGEGTGLGMSIVYNTIKKHNGEINIKSTINEGTEIEVIIPVIHEIVPV